MREVVIVQTLSITILYHPRGGSGVLVVQLLQDHARRQHEGRGYLRHAEGRYPMSVWGEQLESARKIWRSSSNQAFVAQVAGQSSDCFLLPIPRERWTERKKLTLTPLYLVV